MPKTAIRRRRVRTVEFVCPRCGVDRLGTEFVLRHWQRFADIPILPSRTPERIVVCHECDHQSDLGVLEIPTTVQLSRMLEAATFSAVVALVRATVGPDAIDVRRRALAVLTAEGHDDDPTSLNRAVSKHPGDVFARRSRQLRNELTPLGKRSLLHRVASVVTCDLPVTADQRRVLRTIGSELGMDSAAINDVLSLDVEA